MHIEALEVSELIKSKIFKTSQNLKGYLVFFPNGRLRRRTFAIYFIILSVLSNIYGIFFNILIDNDAGIGGAIFACMVFVWPFTVIGLKRSFDVDSVTHALVWALFNIMIGLAIFAKGLGLDSQLERESQATNSTSELLTAGDYFILAIVTLVPLVAAIINFMLFFKSGTTGPNRFGKDPKAKTVA